MFFCHNQEIKLKHLVQMATGKNIDFVEITVQRDRCINKKIANTLSPRH